MILLESRENVPQYIDHVISTPDFFIAVPPTAVICHFDSNSRKTIFVVYESAKIQKSKMGIGDCFENINVPPCVWFEGGDKRNAYASLLSGFLFFVGWWIIIDASSVYPGNVVAGYHMCGVVGTISLIMVNSVSNAQIRGDAYEGGCLGPRGARIWLFLGFVMGFASVIASCWILFADFVGSDDKNKHRWCGVGLFLQNAFIFIASLIFKFGRSEDIWT